MTIDEQRIWRTVCAALVLLLVCGGVACGAEAEVAEAAADGVTWLPVAYAVGGSAVGGGGVWVYSKLHRVQIEPQPLEVRAAKEYATRTELQALRKVVDDGIKHANQRIDAVATSTARVDGKLDNISITQQQILKILLKNDH